MLRKSVYQMDKMVWLSLVLGLLSILLGHQAILGSARSTAKYTHEDKIKYFSDRFKSESAKESALNNNEETPQSSKRAFFIICNHSDSYNNYDY